MENRKVNYKDLRIVFMGTPKFARDSLERLIEEFNVVLVVSQPDRPKGRGKKVIESEVKALAVEKGIEVITPLKLKDDKEAVELLKTVKADFFIVVAFGQILPLEVLEIPKYASINLHASLLPKLRGAAPIQSTILQGDKVTGNTTMLMGEGLDTGDILMMSEVPIGDTMTFGELHDLLKDDGKELLVKTIKEYADGKITPEKQDEEKASYVTKFDKSLARIDFSRDSKSIVNKIRAMNPKPMAFAYLGENLIKFGKADVLENEYTGVEAPGTILSVDKNGIKVKTGDGAVLLLEIQMPGKKMVSIRDFLNGNSLDMNEIFR